MSRRERTVKAKFVTATERDVKVGEENPISEKIVAEKYIKEFCEGIKLVMRIMRSRISTKREQANIRSHRVAGDLEASTLLSKLDNFLEYGRAPTNYRPD